MIARVLFRSWLSDLRGEGQKRTVDTAISVAAVESIDIRGRPFEQVTGVWVSVCVRRVPNMSVPVVTLVGTIGTRASALGARAGSSSRSTPGP